MEYVSIRVGTLRGDQKIDFDAYVKINDKFILYVRQGDSFEGTRLVRLKEKKLKKMFILPDHENNYRNYMHKNIEMAYDKKSSKTIETRAEIIQGAQQSHAEEIMENPENVAAYQEAKSAALKFVNFINEEEKSLPLIMGFENLDASIAHHGVNVSTFSVTLAKRLDVVDPKLTQMLTLGALLHDLGHYNSSVQINRPLEKFTPEELAIYKKHPTEGGKRAQDKKHFDQTVINIIVQHEEFIDGKGFPNGLIEQKLDPLSVITGTANALDRLISFEGISKKEAVKSLLLKGVGRYPLKYIQILGDILNSIKT